MPARSFFQSAKKRRQGQRRSAQLTASVTDHSAPAGDGVHQVAQPGEVAGVEQRLVTPEEVAAFLGVPVRQVYKLVHHSHLPFRRVGRLMRFNQAEVDAWSRPGSEAGHGLRLVRGRG